jgi:UDP-glucose 4-epimerase
MERSELQLLVADKTPNSIRTGQLVRTAMVTGSSGYLGSHVCKLLKANDWKVVGYDTVEPKHPYVDMYIQDDIRNGHSVFDVLDRFKPSVIFHFAGRIEIDASYKQATEFYNVNAGGTYNILNSMRVLGLNHIIYSSTAGIYEPKNEPIKEIDSKNWDNNPYAGSKMAAEHGIQHSGLSHVIFRYFNLAGASVDNTIGECHNPETHLIPRIYQNLNSFKIYGNDYATPDGTCIRDYVHVEDVAEAHLLAAEYLLSGKEPLILNLGTGNGYSVKQIIETAENVIGQKIDYQIVSRRPGDPDLLVADISLAEKILTFRPKHDIISILQTAYNWHLKNDKQKT